MNTKSRSLKRDFTKKRGIVLGVVLFVMATAGLAAVVGLASMMAKVTYNVDYGYAAYSAAKTCMQGFDNLQPSTTNFNAATCVNGAGVNFLDSTASSVVCEKLGKTQTVKTLNSACSCTTQILAVNAGSYDTISTGVCGSSGDRTDNGDKYTVSITKTINGCETCNQFCPAPLGAGSPCVTSCGISCGSCCVSANCSAGVCQP